MISISDVAKHAGVSSTTVSHTLSGKRKVSSSVQERVLRSMRELGYVPSRSAQNLANGRTRIIGLLVPDISNGFFAELAKGVEECAIASGYNVMLCTTGFDHERERLYLEMIRSHTIDGLVYAAGAPPSTSELGSILGDLPLVLVDEEVPGSQASLFVSDNADGGRQVAEHLLELGHRTCLVLAANEELVSSAQRVEGFSRAWRDGAGQGPDVALGGFTEAGGRAAVSPYIDAFRDGSYTSIFAVNDLMAIGAMDELHRAGVQVPGTVSVAGFDDISPARYTRPSLTTIHQDVTSLGEQATAALIAALDGSKEFDHQHHVRPVRLIMRESTARAPASEDIEARLQRVDS